MTRQEHMQYVEAGDLTNAFASMGSDLNKHPETEGHVDVKLGMMMLMSGQLSTPEAMREFINGFN